MPRKCIPVADLDKTASSYISPWEDAANNIDGPEEDDKGELIQQFREFVTALPPRIAKVVNNNLMSCNTPCIADIAREAGVSRQYCSRQLHKASRKVWGADAPVFKQ